jgi:bifunctional UDP-N-acetylglucosamine pyrophosphorylase/glucosamine-1-phosphate N-acetyltransferase
MRSKLPKMLHPLCGLPMTAHVIRACQQAGVERIVVVVGHEAEAVKAGLGNGVEYALQAQQRGTGDAVRAAQPLLGDWPGAILVLAGDVPLLPGATLARLLAHHQETGADATLLTATMDDPTGYGRVVRGTANRVVRIVEHKDANEAERQIKEWNPSLYAFDSAALWSSLADVQPANTQGEYYLTDTIGLLAGRGARIEAVASPDARDVLGVNTRVELANCAAILQQRLLTTLMLSGVTITDPANTYVDIDVEIGQDTVIEPNTYLLRGAKIGEDCVLGPLTRIENSVLGNGVRVLASQVVDSVLEEGAKVGPFANLRSGTHLGKKVKIGDFVETKNARFHDGAQASHLSYIGDAEIGEGTNIGGGTITCNYDGYKKHRTIIGKRAFIGSNSTLVAPITIGDGAFVAAASAITMDVPNDAMGIARSLPTIKEGWAAQYHARQAQGKAHAAPNSTPDTVSADSQEKTGH